MDKTGRAPMAGLRSAAWGGSYIPTLIIARPAYFPNPGHVVGFMVKKGLWSALPPSLPPSQRVGSLCSSVIRVDCNNGPLHKSLVIKGVYKFCFY